MYTIRHKTKKGGSGLMATPNFDDLELKVKRLFWKKLEATVYAGDTLIGRVWKDKSNRGTKYFWNYSIEKQ